MIRPGKEAWRANQLPGHSVIQHTFISFLPCTRHWSQHRDTVAVQNEALEGEGARCLGTTLCLRGSSEGSLCK